MNPMEEQLLHRLTELDSSNFKAKFNKRTDGVTDALEGLFGNGSLRLPYGNTFFVSTMEELRGATTSKNRHTLLMLRTYAEGIDGAVLAVYKQNMQFMQDGSVKTQRPADAPACIWIENHILQEICRAKNAVLTMHPTLRDTRRGYSGFLPEALTEKRKFGDFIQQFFSSRKVLDEMRAKIEQHVRADERECMNRDWIRQLAITIDRNGGNGAVVIRLGKKMGSILIQSSSMTQVMNVKSFDIMKAVFPFIVEAFHLFANRNRREDEVETVEDFMQRAVPIPRTPRDRKKNNNNKAKKNKSSSAAASSKCKKRKPRRRGDDDDDDDSESEWTSSDNEEEELDECSDDDAAWTPQRAAKRPNVSSRSPSSSTRTSAPKKEMSFDVAGAIVAAAAETRCNNPTVTWNRTWNPTVPTIPIDWTGVFAFPPSLPQGGVAAAGNDPSIFTFSTIIIESPDTLAFIKPLPPPLPPSAWVTNEFAGLC